MFTCPVCGALRRAECDACDACGLVFASLAAPPQPVQPLRPGQLLDGGRYLLQGPLASGGMATIFLASDRHAFGRIVAVKALPERALRDERERAAALVLLEYEAQLLARLSHPHIPRLLSAGWHGGQRYLALEYVAGGDLLARLTREDDLTGQPIAGAPYDRADVLRWGRALCTTLEYLAMLQPVPVVHGDIKPANIVCDPASDAVYLIDFGAASAGAGPLGTPGYAPPEQYRGAGEPRSDVYALAATLYHLATDDDPGLHPSRFPLLEELGALGDALRPALNADPALRPTAAALRCRLQALDAPDIALLTPDGAVVADELALAAWCERNWHSAAAWLYDRLPAQAARWRGAALAEALRAIVAAHASRDAGLDAALALLDPAGYGAAAPTLVASAGALDFGRLRVGAAHTLVVANTGRRYTTAALLAPAWLGAQPGQLALAPGQQANLVLQANAAGAAGGGQLCARLHLEADAALLTAIAVRARAPWHPTRAWVGAWGAGALLALLVALCALAAWSLL